MKAAAIAILAAAALCMVAPHKRSWGHGPGSEWLMDGGYRSQDGTHCCSPNKDCNPIPASDIEMTKDGWRYKPTGEIIPDANVFRSRDPEDRPWRCEGTRYWLGNEMQPVKTRCLFVGGTS